MKKITIITAILLFGAIAFISCNGNKEPGRVYMPDMAYSRAYESYAYRDSNIFTMDRARIGGNMIFFNNMPATGTIKRGELFPYPLPGDSNGYRMSAMVKNPFDSISKAQLTEAGRLFNINCGICHGATGAGNGPLAASGHIGGVANLTGADYIKMADGTMFHSVTYGKGVMGSYASQLTRAQRWMVIKYIRTLQPKPAAEATATATATGTATGTAPAAATADTTKAKGQNTK